MKTINYFLAVFALAVSAVLFSGNTQAQNYISNGNFSSWGTNWNADNMAVEMNPENVYGGTSASNITAEIDVQVGLRQRTSTILR